MPGHRPAPRVDGPEPGLEGGGGVQVTAKHRPVGEIEKGDVVGFGEGVGGRPGVAAGHVERLEVELVGLVASSRPPQDPRGGVGRPSGEPHADPAFALDCSGEILGNVEGVADAAELPEGEQSGEPQVQRRPRVRQPVRIDQRPGERLEGVKRPALVDMGHRQPHVGDPAHRGRAIGGAAASCSTAPARSPAPCRTRPASARALICTATSSARLTASSA